MQHKKLPRLLLTNYLKDDHESLSYKLHSVSSKYKKPEKIVNTTSHSDCPNIATNLPVAMAYFCVNPTTGSIYSTKSLVDSMVADDVFTLIIEVSDIVRFPPRITNVTVTMTAKSVCTSKTKAFRDMTNSSCDQTFVESNLVRVDGNKFRLDVKDGSIHYISGILGQEGLKNESPDRNGSHVVITLRNKGKTTGTKHYFTGSYASFTPPLRYKSGDEIALDSSALFTSGQAQIYTFQFQLWKIVLTKQVDYCSVEPNCSNLYQSYENEYMKNPSEIVRKCPNPDVYGFKAKYFYCAGKDFFLISGTCIKAFLKTKKNLLFRKFEKNRTVPTSSSYKCYRGIH